MRKWTRISFPLAIVWFLAACNLAQFGSSAPTGEPPAAATATGTPVPPAADTPAETVAFTGAPPGEPPTAVSSWLTDPLSPDKPKDDYAVAGDDFAIDRYERPFDAQLAYRADLDIVKASLVRAGDWLYAAIELADVNPASRTLGADYGIEIDDNLDGRGDYVVWARPPFTAEWTRATVSVYGTSTNMVGGPTPLKSDAPWTGATYDTTLFDPNDSARNMAWARISPENPKILQIAFSPDLLKVPDRFLWGAWADDGVKDPAKFDYNDAFTKQEAGSAYKWDPDYPPKALTSVDNTCRAPFGFNAKGNEPGICEIAPPPGKQPSGPTPTRTLVPPF
jgi:hypothetical protein